MNRRLIRTASLLYCLVVGLLVTSVSLSGVVWAGAPGKVNLQGILRAEDGSLREGTFNFKVQIFPSPSSDTAFLEETFTDVPVTSGVFSLELGKSTPTLSAGLAAATEPEMLVTVNGSALPRQPLSSSLYALHAQTVPFSGLLSFPAACPGSSVLTGYGAGGTAICTAEGSVQRRTAANPATCPSGQFLKSIAADGTPVCGAVSMSCGFRTSAATSLSARASCESGEIIVSGGCSSAGGALIANHPDLVCVSPPCFFCLFGSRCPPNVWQCQVSSGNVTAYAQCCSVNQ